MTRALLVIGLALATLPGGACTRSQQGSSQLKIKGSDTMVNLASAWAEAFREVHPDIALAVTGGGSGTGIAALIGGTCDIAQASRRMKDKEKKQAAALGSPVEEIEVALDCVVVCVHPQNPVEELTIAQLAGIFRGDVRRWSEVGGRDGPIHAVSRERNSGTHVYFLERVVREGDERGPGEYAAEVGMLPSSQAVFEEVRQNANAIGYYGLGYLAPGNRALAIAPEAGAEAVAPSTATAKDGTYPLARPLFFYTSGRPTGAAKTFIDFVLGPKGQAVVAREDFVPLAAVGGEG